MQKHVNTKLNWKTLVPAAITGALFITPLLGAHQAAVAKPGHGKARGHAKQDNWQHRDNRGDRDDHRRWDRDDNHRRNDNDNRRWDRDDDHNRRSNNNDNRRYRTRRNSNGTITRNWVRKHY